MWQSIRDWVAGLGSDVATGAGNVAAGAMAEWNAKVAELKRLAMRFTSVYNRLMSMRGGLTGSDASRVDEILRNGNVVKASVMKVAAGVDGVASMMPANMLQGYSGGLGWVPLVPLAVVAAAIAALTAWLKSAEVELARLELAEKVREGGGDPGDVLWGGSRISPTMMMVGGGVLALTVGVLISASKAK